MKDVKYKCGDVIDVCEGEPRRAIVVWVGSKYSTVAYIDSERDYVYDDKWVILERYASNVMGNIFEMGG